MNGALVADLLQPLALRFILNAMKGHQHFESIRAFLFLTIIAIDFYADAFQRPLLTPRIHLRSDRLARSQREIKVVMRVGSTLFPAKRHGHIGMQVVETGNFHPLAKNGVTLADNLDALAHSLS